MSDIADKPQQLSFGETFDPQSKYRLFFAIQPDACAADRLKRLLRRLSDEGIMRGRPVDTDRLHVTVLPLGDFADPIPPSLLSTAREAATMVKRPPFEVAFDRVGGTRGPFLLRPAGELKGLQTFRQTLGAALIRTGFRLRVDLTFKPHVTLSYDFSEVPERPIEPINWTVRQFVLIESRIGKHQHIEYGPWLTHP